MANLYKLLTLDSAAKAVLGIDNHTAKGAVGKPRFPLSLTKYRSYCRLAAKWSAIPIPAP